MGFLHRVELALRAVDRPNRPQLSALSFAAMAQTEQHTR